MLPNFGLDQHVSFIGKTGSGKTYLARYLNENAKRLVVFDAKNQLGKTFNTVEWSKGIKQFSRGSYGRLRVGAIAGSSNEIADLYEPYFETILNVGNCVVYIDELYAITGGSNTVKRYLNSLFTMGRGLGISMRISTQRPSRIPLVTLSEPEWFFIFRLQIKEDIKRAAGLIGLNDLERIKDKHGFYMANTVSGNVFYVPKLKIINKTKKP